MERYNCWWRGEEDEDYTKWRNQKIKWVPELVNDIKLKPFSMHFLIGPRQVGKTTLLKILIHKLLEKKVNPKSIFYYSCDELLNHKELGEVLDNYIAAKKERKIKKSLIVLDEITFVEEWWRAIKARIDRGELKNDVVILSGSASIELLEQKERFPGRRGEGRDYILYPLSFDKYLELYSKNEMKKTKNIEKSEKAMKANKIFLESIRKAFKKYLITGGFPLPIRDMFTEGRIKEETRRTYLDWIRGDLRKAGKSERYAKEVISYILQAHNSAISWLSIAKSTSINSSNTAQDYIEILEKLFIAKVLYLLTPDFKIKYRKNKKVHFIDPFVYNIFSGFTKIQTHEDALVESIVAMHLARKFPTYYWKNRTEIDAVSVVKGKQIGFEVKWGPKKWIKPRHIKKTFLLTKERIPLFLASIKWNT